MTNAKYILMNRKEETCFKSLYTNRPFLSNLSPIIGNRSSTQIQLHSFWRAVLRAQKRVV